MAFDPSVISSIGDSQADIPASIGKAMQLREMSDRNQLNALQLGSAKEEASDSAKVKDILKQSDYTTPQGLAKTASAVNRVSPKAAMDLMKQGQQYQSGQVQQQLDQYTLAEKRQDMIVGTLDGVIAEARNLKNSGGSDLDVNALITQRMPGAIQQLRNEKLPDGAPALPDDQLKMISGQPFTLATLEGWEAKSKQGQQQIKQRLEQFKADTQAKKETSGEAGEAERVRHDEAMEAHAASTGSKKAPAGFEWDPDKPDELRPIKGGPKDPNSKPWSGREKIFGERILTSADEAVRAIQNITELPVKASSGWFGTGGGQEHGLFSSGKGALTNTLAPQDVQDYNTMLAGVKRNLATIESVGLAPSGALTEGFGSLELRQGDSNLTKLRKLAEMRQVVEAGLEPQLADSAIPDQIKDLMRHIQGNLEKAVPYTQHDVTTLQRAQKKNPDLTLEELIGKDKLGAPPAGPKPDAAGHELAPGSKYQHPSGATVEIVG